nr:MFS transporter [uncultured Eisenbergiella sp.]
MKKGFSKDFYLVMIGQIISLFGNAVIRFALPLHLLTVTQSPSLLGIVSGFAFLPLAVMSPVGGLIADRVNKRNIMVVLDFFTAGLVLSFLLFSGRVSLVGLILVMLFLLYGISGAYQPSVQSSIPLLVAEESIMPANALINMISSLSGLLGPALGGIAYGLWGITPILYVCAGCFFLSAVMELFIHIPFTRKERTCSLFRELTGDVKDSILFITREKKQIGKLTLCCTAVNLFLSALMIISLPVIVMQVLSFPRDNASEMYGFLQAVMAAGGLAGGMAAGIFSKKLNIRGSWKLLFVSSLLLLPMGAVLQEGIPVYAAYSVIAVSGLIIMAFASLYTIQIMSYIQLTTPAALIGKVIAWIIALSTCAQPAGQMIYGFLLERLPHRLWVIFAVTAVFSMLVALWNRKIAERL